MCGSTFVCSYMLIIIVDCTFIFRIPISKSQKWFWDKFFNKEESSHSVLVLASAGDTEIDVNQAKSTAICLSS